jgi:hypothetical protein
MCKCEGTYVHDHNVAYSILLKKTGNFFNIGMQYVLDHTFKFVQVHPVL